MKPWPVTILTLFPEVFPGVLGHSITGRALNQDLWQLRVNNIRDHALPDKHKTVDDTPYGGGAGMVLRPDVVATSIREAKAQQPGAKVIFLTPSGQKFDQNMAEELGAHDAGLIVLCGHYEGIDQRVLDAEVDVEVSIGDYVLSAGEVAAPVVIDACLRTRAGVLGNNETLHEESHSIIDPDSNESLVEYPHYTRPAEWEGQAVPPVLTSGNHAEIAKWRLHQARQRTKKLTK